MSGMARAGRRHVPGRVPRRLGDRIYGCDDCQDVCPPNKIRMRRPSPAGADEAWVDVLSVLDAGDDELLARLGRWYILTATPTICVAMRFSCSAMWPGRPRPSLRLSSVTCGTRRRCCGLTPCGSPVGSVLRCPTTSPTTSRSRSATRSHGRKVRRGSAPARHQRLSSEDRRHPELPLGAVATSARRRRRRAHHPARRAEAWDAPRTSPWSAAATMAAAQPMLVRRVNQLAESYDAEVVIIDPPCPPA